MKEHCPVSPAVVQGKEEEEDEAASAAASVSELRGHMAPLCLGFRQLAGVVAPPPPPWRKLRDWRMLVSVGVAFL